MSRALRARNELAIAHRHHPDQIEQKRRELAEAKIADYVERVVAAAPPLTQEQRARLSAILAGARSESGEKDV